MTLITHLVYFLQPPMLLRFVPLHHKFSTSIVYYLTPCLPLLLSVLIFIRTLDHREF